MTDDIEETHAPRDDLYRAMPGGITSADGKTLTIRLAPHDQWAEISSQVEGHFMERFSRSAYRKTMAEALPKILLNHGKDPQLGEKPIATTDEVGEDETSPFARGRLLDGVPEMVVDGIRQGVYGASHRFSVVREKWDNTPVGGPHNPDKLPERTITEARLFELGPVTWPAYAGASVALRSLTDEMRPPTPPLPVAPSDDAEPQVLTSPERRDEPVTIEATPEQETPTVSEKYESREDKASRVTELEAALRRVASEYPGVLPSDVQADWDANKAELRQLRLDIEAYDDRIAFVGTIGRDKTHVDEPTYAPPTVIRTKPIDDIYDVRAIDGLAPEKRMQTLRDNAMRSLESSHLPKDSNVDGIADFVDLESREDQGEQEATRRILLTGSPMYKRAFAKYLKNGNERGWTPEESRAAALAVTGTTTTGGYAVPYIFDPTFVHIGAWTTVNPYRAACRVETISGGNNWRAVTATAITAKWDAEAAASVEGGPTIGQPTYTVQRADAFATVSIETLQDRPDVTEELSSLFAEAKDTLEENSFTLGVGTTVYPQGMFLSGAFTPKTTATNDVTAIADTQAVEGDLPLRHRMNAAWFMSRSTQRQLEALDTTGYYFKRPGQFFAMGKAEIGNSPTGNTGTQLLGWPIWEVPSAVSTLTTDAAVIAVFCDPRNYVIVDRIGMNVEVVQTMLNGATPSFPTGQRGIYCYWRSTARVLNVDGGRQMKVQ